MAELKLSKKALREIASSDEIELELFKRAEAIRETVDPDGKYGYVAVSGKGRSRSRASVIAAHPYARNSNAKHNSLIRAMGSGRG